MSRRILAIDDSPTMRGLVARTLRGAGFDVYLAADGVEGIGCLMDADPDLIITDVNMPRLDGFGVIEAVRSCGSHSGVPILVLTTESGAELKARARKELK